LLEAVFVMKLEDAIIMSTSVENISAGKQAHKAGCMCTKCKEMKASKIDEYKPTSGKTLAKAMRKNYEDKAINVEKTGAKIEAAGDKHPNFGQFKKTSSNYDGSNNTKNSQYKAAGGDENHHVSVLERFTPKGGDAGCTVTKSKTPNYMQSCGGTDSPYGGKQSHFGDSKQADSHLKKTYGIKHSFGA
jgi:hypothetical protein